MFHLLRFSDGKCFQASQNGKRWTFSLVRGAKIRSSTIRPDQCKATLDVADNDFSWIPFVQNAGPIEKTIAAKQTPQLHPATENCISASDSPNLTVFHWSAKKKCCYSEDICPNIHMIFQHAFVMKSLLLQQQQLWSFSLATLINSKLDKHTRPTQSNFGCSRQQHWLESICTKCWHYW